MASFYVRKSGKTGWVLTEQSYQQNKSIQKTIPKLAYPELGINPDWDLEQARQAVKHLNSRNTQDRTHQSKVSAVSRRVQSIESVSSAYLPEPLKLGFTEVLKESSFGSAAHTRKILSHWYTVCRIIRHLRMDTQDFSAKSDTLYQYFVSKRYSSDYVKKLVRVFNLWGKYVSDHRKSRFSPIPPAKGHKRNKILESYLDSEGYRGESDPLTPGYLEKHPLPSLDQVNWLNLTIWFGLRPIEVDHLKNSKFWRIEKVDGVEVLWVYQSKLTSIAREKRWKPIPCLFPEQTKLLRVIKDGKFKRPILKTLNAYLKTDRITLYGGRKGFIDLMLDRGQRLEDVSAWLGHQSIEMTWKKYRNRRRVSWNKVG